MKNLSRILLVALSLLTAWFLGYIHIPSFSDLGPSVIGILFGINLSLLFFLLFNKAFKKSVKRIRVWLISLILVSTLTVAVSIVMMPFGAIDYATDLTPQIEQLNQTYKDSTTVLARKQLPNLIHEIAVEANQDSLHRISENSIKRLIALSSQFSPTIIYNTLGDSLVKISSERGLLFLQILQLNLDSSSFNEIKTRVNFNYADLRNSDLTGFDLSNTQLKNVHFENAILDSVNFENAQLGDAHFNGAQLQFANFSGSNLEHADFSWSNAYNANFMFANMNGAILDHARFSNTDFRNASAEWASFETTDLSNANLESANLKRASLSKANLNYSNLLHASLYNSELNEASLIRTKFDSVQIIDEEWLEYFLKQNQLGLDSFRIKYKTTSHPSAKGLMIVNQ